MWPPIIFFSLLLDDPPSISLQRHLMKQYEYLYYNGRDADTTRMLLIAVSFVL